MGFVLTLLYVSLALLSPADLLPALAAYRVELILILVAIACSVPNALDHQLFHISQFYLLAGLFICVFLSIALGPVHWLGGGFFAVEEFLSLSVVFFLIALNCRSIRRFEVVTLFLLAIAMFYVVRGANAYHDAKALAEAGKVDSSCAGREAQKGIRTPGDIQTCKVNTALIFVIPLSDGTYNFRMQGEGLLHDPNELAQFLVMLIPLVWVWWRPHQHIRNAFFILGPTALLVWGIYLTHSRGGLLALVVIAMLALKERVNWALTLMAGALAMGGALALDFTGGREISLEAGADRLSIWSDGLELFKSSPVFGVGFHQFQTYIGHTAHNSFLICAAELGAFAYFLWLGLITFTVVDLNSLIAWIRKGRRDNSGSSAGLQGGLQGKNSSDLSDSRNEDYDRWAKALRLSLVGFLAAAWFLSRAYIITLYVLLGMAVTLVWMARNEGQQVDRKTVFRLSAVTVGLGIAIIGAIYVFVRIGHYFLGA